MQMAGIKFRSPILLIIITLAANLNQGESKTNTECTLKCLMGECVASTITVNGQSYQLDQCECSDGWGGVLCDEVGRSCPDGTVCYNGAECFPRHTKMETSGLSQFYCDCDTAYEHSSFAGRMCEAPATHVCEYGVSVSKTAFCTNGGQCKEVVVKDSTSGEEAKHPGCTCPDNFTGSHCEYLVGTQPTEEELASTSKETKAESEQVETANEQAQSSAAVASKAPPSHTASYQAIKIISILFMISIIVLAALLVRHSYRKKKAMKNPQPVINLAVEAKTDEHGMGHSSNAGTVVITNGEKPEVDLEEIDII